MDVGYEAEGTDPNIAYPRGRYAGIRHKPDTTFGNVKADVIADKEPHFNRANFCSVIRKSACRG